VADFSKGKKFPSDKVLAGKIQVFSNEKSKITELSFKIY